MTQHSARHTKTYVILALMVIAGAAGDVLLSKGMKQIGALNAWTPAAILDFLWHVFTHPTVWIGISGLIAYFICYSLLLSWADFSYVLPASALTYVLVPLLAYFWLHEHVRSLRWAGIFLIFLGVVMVGFTPHSTTVARTKQP
jgi:uncharacterized membrane protein